MTLSGFEGRTVLVTGGAGGIGSAVARELYSRGASVAIHYNTGSRRARDLVAELEATAGAHRGQIAVSFPADLRSEEEMATLFEEVAHNLGPLHGLVANAAIYEDEPRPVAQMSLEQWRSTLSVNLDGTFLSCRGFLRQLGQEPASEAVGASIVLVGSTAALFGEAGHADYAASKAALEGLMRSLKNEIVEVDPLARVNVVHPGWVETEMAAEALAQPGMLERTTRTMALRKVAQPEDVARAVCFLLSAKDAGHISGVALPLHGGMEGRTIHSQ